MEGSPARSASSRFQPGSPSGAPGAASAAVSFLAQPRPGEPELACYCGLPARRLTSRTPLNPLRIFLMRQRKFQNGQGCKLWIWEDVLRTYVVAMVLYYAGSAPNHLLFEEISSARQTIALKEKQIEDLVEVYEAKLASLRDQILRLETKPLLSKRGERGDAAVQQLPPSSKFLAILVFFAFLWLLAIKH